MQIPIAQPSLGSEEAEAVTAVLGSGMIAQGPETAAFENEFAAYCGVPHAVGGHCLTKDTYHLERGVQQLGPDALDYPDGGESL